MEIEEIEAVLKLAELELREERFRAAVELKKAELKTKKTFWETVFPYKITITRR